MKQISVSLRLGYPIRSGPDGPQPPIARLEIQDEASRIHFLELELDAEQLMNFMRGSAAYATAEMRGLDRVGKRMEVDVQHLGQHATLAGAQMVADDWAAETGPWDTLQVSKRRDGWVATGRRWVEVEEREGSGS